MTNYVVLNEETAKKLLILAKEGAYKQQKNDYYESKEVIDELEELLNGEQEPITTSFFWDCECPEDPQHPYNYIHAAEPTDEGADCAVCGANQHEQPDSHLNEVIDMLIQNSEKE